MRLHKTGSASDSKVYQSAKINFKRISSKKHFVSQTCLRLQVGEFALKKNRE